MSCAGSFPELTNIHLGRDVTFITTQELEDMYPDYTPKQRENAFAKEHGTIFIMKIGGKLQERQAPRRPRPGLRRLGAERRHPFLACALWAVRWSFPVHGHPCGCGISATASWTKPAARSVRNCPSTRCCWTATLPLTMGGGIGQSRLCMLLLGKAHVGEVQVSLWDDDTVAACEKAGIALL